MRWPLIGRDDVLERAREQVPNGIGVAILGPAGVGKSRLMQAVLEQVEQAGTPVLRLAASASTRSIPFATFVDLLPAGPTDDRLGMLRAALAAIEERAGPRGIVLAVDDAHQLDPGSLALLLGAITARAATVCLTARSGEPMEPDLVTLWTNGVIERIDIEPLPEETTRALLSTVLGAHSSELAAELWLISRGNPLVLHELIEGAIDRSIERDELGEWTKTGTLARSDRLGDLVVSRLRALPDNLRAAMEIVAVGSPVPRVVVEHALTGELDELERRGLVATTPGDPRSIVVAHPLYGEILKENLAEPRRRAANWRLAEAAIHANGAVDPVRAAVWQLDSGEILSVDLVKAGGNAALARHDAGLAEQLVRPLDTDDDEGALLLGRALSQQQRYDEAEATLCERTPDDPDLAGQLASARAQNLAFGLGRIGEAHVLLAAAAEQVLDPNLRGRLNNERAMISSISGDFVDAEAASADVLADGMADDVTRAAAYVTGSVALAMTGDCDRMAAIVDDADACTRRVRSELPFANDQVLIMWASALVVAGRLDEASELAERATAEHGGANVMAPTWLSASVLTHNVAGRLRHSADAASTAIDLYVGADPFGLEAQARGMLSLALAQMGDPDAAQPIDGLSFPVPAPRVTVWVDRGRAWSVATAGDLEEAAHLTCRGGRAALEGQHSAWAALCLHDAVRFGRPELAIEGLRDIDTSKGAHLLTAFCSHAEAAVANDAAGVAAAAEWFAGAGAWLYAAEAWADAAVRYGEREASAAGRASALSTLAEARCEAPATPLLLARPSVVSEREIEVAAQAARGATSPDIAKRLYISVRTVDNHLRAVYRKLDLTGRSGLAQVLSRVLTSSE